MGKLAERKPTEISIANNAMLKQLPAQDFQELLAGYLLKCIKLNMEPLPEPETLGMIAKELFYLLQKSWPGVRPNQVWATLKAGMAKGGQYRVRINYPTVANWLMYHRVATPEQGREKELNTPSLNTQAEGVLAGLKEYRERVAKGEYKPQGRKD